MKVRIGMVLGTRFASDLLTVLRVSEEKGRETMSDWGEISSASETNQLESLVSGKPLRKVVQIDCCGPGEAYSSLRWDPKRCPIALRIHILDETSKADALDLMREAIEVIENWSWCDAGADWQLE
jgi:hypothetical protein